MRIPFLFAMTNPLYTTTDSHLASFLVSEGAQFAGLKRMGPKRVLFSFVADQELHLLMRLYWGGHRIPVIPAKLLDALHTLKCRSISRR